MDNLHYILITIIIVIIILNNIKLIRTHYYKLFFSFLRKVHYIIEKRDRKNNLPKKFKKSPQSKVNTIYLDKTISCDKLKIIQKKLSWKYRVAVLNLNCNLNIGAIYRTGCLLGMKEYIILGKKIYHPKSQVGLDYINIKYLDTFKSVRDRHDPTTIENFNINKFCNYISKNKLKPVIIEQGGTNLLNIDFSINESDGHNLLFIFGNETHGTPTNLLKKAKKEKWIILSIPQWGCAHSYNVSQAANIIMWKYYTDNIKKLEIKYID